MPTTATTLHRRCTHRGRAPGRPHPRAAPAARRPRGVRRGAATSSRSPAGTRSSSCVGNATQTAHYYQSAWGMELEAYSRPRERQPRPQVLRAALRLDPLRASTARVDPDSPLLDHHRRHGDGVVDLALEVPDVDKCIAHAREAGATRRRASPTTSPTSTAPSGSPPSRRTARPGTPLVDRSPLRRPVPARLRRRERPGVKPRGPAEAALPGPRPLSSATSSSARWTSGWSSTTG